MQVHLPFAFSSLRIPSKADTPVSHQDPQSDGQKSSKPYTLVTLVTTAHQELPAPPKLTAFHLLYFCRARPSQTSVNPNTNPQDRAFFGSNLLIAY